MTTGPKGTDPPSSSAWIPMPRTSFAHPSKSSTIQVRFFSLPVFSLRYFTLSWACLPALFLFLVARSSCLSFFILISNTCLPGLLAFLSRPFSNFRLSSVSFHSSSILYVCFPSTHHLRYLVCLLFIPLLIMQSMYVCFLPLIICLSACLSRKSLTLFICLISFSVTILSHLPIFYLYYLLLYLVLTKIFGSTFISSRFPSLFLFFRLWLLSLLSLFCLFSDLWQKFDYFSVILWSAHWFGILSLYGMCWNIQNTKKKSTHCNIFPSTFLRLLYPLVVLLSFSISFCHARSSCLSFCILFPNTCLLGLLSFISLSLIFVSLLSLSIPRPSYTSAFLKLQSTVSCLLAFLSIPHAFPSTSIFFLQLISVLPVVLFLVPVFSLVFLLFFHSSSFF